MKNKSNFSLHKVILFFTILNSSCANISTPTGGPKDVIPPKLLSSIPKQGKTNYSEKTIQLIFNEDINPQFDPTKLIITPLTEIPLKYKIKKNKLTLTFENNLDTNTTYTINFRETIKDITEGNTSPNLLLAFSTGRYIDSNLIEGNIKEIQTNQAKSDILVGLYQTSDSFQAKSKKPYYFTKSNKDGSFKLENIKSNVYDLIAIDDKNKNLLFDENENIALIKNINLDSIHHNKQELKLSKYYASAPAIKSIKENDDNLEIKINHGIKSFSLYTDTKDEFYPTLSNNGCSIFLFKSFKPTDSIPITIELIDSVGNMSEDKIKIFYSENKNESKKPIQLTFQPKDNKLEPDLAEITISSNKPIVKIDTSQISIKEDTNIINIKNKEIKKVSYDKIEIIKPNKAKDSLFIIIKEKAIITYDTFNVEQKIKFEIKKEENYSLLEAKIITSKKSYIIQLLDKNFQVIATESNVNKVYFNYINPGTYYLRAVIDENKNGYWDAGNLVKNEHPENIIFYPNQIELRANWEIRDLKFEF